MLYDVTIKLPVNNHLAYFRSKPFQSSYCAKVGARYPKKNKRKKGRGRGGEKRRQFPPLPSPPPSFLFFALFPAFSMNLRRNACYTGEGLVCYTAVLSVVTQRCVTTLKTAVWQTSEGLAQRKHNLSDEEAEPDVWKPHFLWTTTLWQSVKIRN